MAQSKTISPNATRTIRCAAVTGAGWAALVTLSLSVAACAPADKAAGEIAEQRPATARVPVNQAEAPRDVARESVPSSARPRIVFLGDSLTAGYGLAREQSFPSLIQARLDAEGYRYEVVNAGVSGDTSAGGLSRLAWSLDGDVAVLVVGLGGNDGLRGLPVASMKGNLEEIIMQARKRGITVMLVGMEAPPNYGAAYTTEFREAFRDLAREHDVPFVPFFLEGVAGNSSLNLPDGIHPNAAGARVVADHLWPVLEPLLDRRSDTALQPRQLGGSTGRAATASGS
jgi:acyl-CoA thioesterase I